MTKINLGDKVKDTVTGFVGIAVGRSEWLTGCSRVVVQPQCGKDGKIPDSATFDEPTLVVIKPVAKKKQSSSKGGPRPEISKRSY